MKQIKTLFVLAASAVLAACGGSDGAFLGAPTSVLDTEVTTVELTASSTNLNSSATGETSVQIFAQVLDENNAVVEGVVVGFSATSGEIRGTQSQTDSDGVAIATLNNGGNPTNRTITVTANADGVTGEITINVIGTTISIDCPPAISLNDSIDCQVQVEDFAGSLIETTVTATSANGNTLSATEFESVDTGPSILTLTADNPGDDSVTVSALGESDSADVVVSGDIFSIQAPLADTELPLNTPVDIDVLWTKDTVPQAGEIITFSSTRGTLSGGNGDGTATTDGTGVATLQVTSTSAGPVTLSVINDESTTTTRRAEFVADTPATLDLQANPLTVAVTTPTTITASVFDANGNAVKNKVVQFSIEQDSSVSSFLSAGLAVTNSNGRASTTYTAGTTPSASNGVIIRATVLDPTAVTNTVALTVAARAIDTAIGTGNQLFEPTTSLFSQEWAIIVTDTSGTAPEPVANTNVQASIRSVRYFKGYMSFFDSDPTVGIDLDWAPTLVPEDFSTAPPEFVRGYQQECLDEDLNVDGFLDPAEDINMSGQLEAGNRATLTALAPGADPDACGQITSLGGPTTLVQTDESGIARVCVVYVQSDNLWVEARISSLLTVFGTEYTESQKFILPALAEDLDDETGFPPGANSPFGTQPGCNNTD